MQHSKYMTNTKNSTRIEYTLNGEKFTTYRREGESKMAAVTRSVAKRSDASVTLWPAARLENGELFTAKWFDSETECFCEGEVVV